MLTSRTIRNGLAAAIVVQLTMAGIAVGAGQPAAQDAAGLERAEILHTVGIAESVALTAAQATSPMPLELAAPGAPQPVRPAAAPTGTASATSEPPTAVPVPAAPSTSLAPPPTTMAPLPTTDASVAATSGRRDAGCEVSMLGWMNESRAEGGVGALADDPVVDHVAFRWSDHLAVTGELRHNPHYGDQVFEARPQAMTAGEVVGRGSGARAIFEEFLRSPTHRGAIVQRAFTHATVGCVSDAGGQVWVVTNFWG